MVIIRSSGYTAQIDVLFIQLYIQGPQPQGRLCYVSLLYGCISIRQSCYQLICMLQQKQWIADVPFTMWCTPENLHTAEKVKRQRSKRRKNSLTGRQIINMFSSQYNWAFQPWYLLTSRINFLRFLWRSSLLLSLHRSIWTFVLTSIQCLWKLQKTSSLIDRQVLQEGILESM